MGIALGLSFGRTLGTFVPLEICIRFRVTLCGTFGFGPVKDFLLPPPYQRRSIVTVITGIRRYLVQDMDHIKNLLHTESTIFLPLLRYNS